jgi:hypothetical protein
VTIGGCPAPLTIGAAIGITIIIIVTIAIKPNIFFIVVSPYLL